MKKLGVFITYRKALYPGRNQNKNESGTKIPAYTIEKINVAIAPVKKSNKIPINILHASKPV